MSKTFKVLLGMFVAVVVVVGAAGAYYALHDSAEDEASLAAIPTGSAAPGGASTRTSADGDWTVQPGEGVFVGYRIHEKLRGLDKEVTGRTAGVTGSMTIAGDTVTKAQFTADLTGLKTDEALRDNALKQLGPQTAKYPQATFELTGPLKLPSTPKPGEPISVTAPGILTLHGVTKPVQVPLQAQWLGDTINVASATGGVRIEFKDYGFDAITVPVATTDAFAFLELQLVFAPA
jgi:polyisoprenoid-binding protein YceI